jgi:hypothetical protein
VRSGHEGDATKDFVRLLGARQGSLTPPDMRLFSSHVTPIATECVRILLAAGDIEADSPKEVEADIESVLKTYLQTEREVNDRTKELLERTGRGTTEYSRVREQIADSKGIKVGDEMLDYLLDQVVEILNHSHHVEEIFAEDVALRRKMAPVFKRHMDVEGGLDAEVRAQIRNVKEGSSTWDIEYARVMEATKRKKGLL